MGCTGSSEQVQIPCPLSSLARHEWIAWKKCFRSYMDHKGIPYCQRGEKFYKYIGFLGEEISKKLYFANTIHETKYEILLFKFDVYFIFSTNGIIRKTDNQDFKEYVSLLKNIAQKISSEKIVEVVKEKILQDFKSENLFDRLKKLDIHSRISNYENLTLHELLFLWEEYDNLESIDANHSCILCNRYHPYDKCYADGKQCWKCGERNHFARCCKKRFLTKCTRCGSKHAPKMCPACTKECSKCKQLNHFSWMCNTDIIQDCIYCGRSHRNGRNHCSAGNSTCMTCSRKGHYTSQCFYKKR